MQLNRIITVSIKEPCGINFRPKVFVYRMEGEEVSNGKFFVSVTTDINLGFLNEITDNNPESIVKVLTVKAENGSGFFADSIDQIKELLVLDQDLTIISDNPCALDAMMQLVNLSD